MISLDVKDVAIVKQKQALEDALSTNPKTQKALQNLIREVIQEAREKAVNNTHFDNGDPRAARESIRTTVYKKILGANINIYNSRKAGKPTNYEPPRTLQPGQVGGNRRPRSEKTKRMMSYGPHDRGMVLRWLNSGTAGRETRYGNRGAITARNWFAPKAQNALSQAADRLANLIDTELNDILNKKK